MGSGKNKAAEDQQTALARQQQQTSQEMIDFSKQRTALMDKLQQPGINFAMGLASGDPTKMMAVAAQPLGQIAGQYRAAKENIYDSIPTGAARDFALSGLERDRASSNASALNSGYLQAFNTLLGLGGQQGQFGLQQLGAGITSGQAAGQTNKTLMDAAAQRKASQMGFLGSLAQMGGMAATGGMGGGGGMFGKLFAGGAGKVGGTLGEVPAGVNPLAGMWS